MSMATHQPVLLAPVLSGLLPGPGGPVIDATVGLGGHAEALLTASPNTVVLGLDVDPEALAVAGRRLAPFAGRFELILASYTKLAEIAAQRHVTNVGGVLFDLGVSSLQLDSPERGFSFRHDGPLDMRFGREGPTAAELVANTTEADLVRMLFEFGEERRSRRIARAIVRARERAPILTTGDLARIVRTATGGPRGRIDPATRTFQALRIATNHELDGVSSSLEQAARLLSPGARLAVIAFHSLEDRLVKQTFRRLSGRCVCPPGTAICQCNPERLLEVVTQRPITATDEEVGSNPRSRSARLRLAERLP
jgi:16S rRNA (cytosine1402-N4)-methyltransferase